MMELLINTVGREDLALELLTGLGFGVQMNPDIANSFLLPDDTDCIAVEDALQRAGIEYQWLEDDEGEELLGDGPDDLILLEEEE